MQNDFITISFRLHKKFYFLAKIVDKLVEKRSYSRINCHGLLANLRINCHEFTNKLSRILYSCIYLYKKTYSYSSLFVDNANTRYPKTRQISLMDMWTSHRYALALPTYPQPKQLHFFMSQIRER